jgi:hypothetical protein
MGASRVEEFMQNHARMRRVAERNGEEAHASTLYRQHIHCTES